jgi:hypothetical protein
MGTLRATTMASPHPALTERSLALVWIDAREALIIRSRDGEPVVERVASDVPGRVRSTGQVRHRPGVHHGGGAGDAEARGDRLELLNRFVARVTQALDPDEDLVIEGPATVRGQLEHAVRDADHGRPRPRDVRCEAAPRRTQRQLIERWRSLVGDAPRRRVVGAGSS